MALLRILIPYQWRAFWRGIRARGPWGGTNLTLVVLLALWLLPAHVTSAYLAAYRMRIDPAGSGEFLTEMTLSSLLVAWLLTPLFITGLQAHGEGLTPWRLARFPLRLRELMLAGVSGSLIHPGYWILVFASLVGLVPVALAPHPVAGLVAGAVFFVAAATLSWALGLFGSVLFSSRRAREFAILAVAVVADSFVFLAGARTERSHDALFVTAWGHRWLVVDAAREHGLLPALRDNTAGAWVVRVAMGRSTVPSLALLAGWFAASWALATWSLRRIVRQPVTGLGGGRGQLASLGGLPFLPTAVGVAARKELRYLMRTMDTLLGIAIGLGATGYVVIADHPTRLVLVFAIPFILVMEMAMPMNVFGLDRSGVDRYRLFPLRGTEVVLSKNVAFFLVGLAQVVPLLVAAAARFGPLTALAALFGTAALALLLAIWGNVTSIRAPAPRAFYNFDSTEQAGGVTSILYCVFVWLAPAAVGVFTAMRGDLALVAGELALAAACAFFYRRMLRTAGAEFEARAESMRKRLAG